MVHLLFLNSGLSALLCHSVTGYQVASFGPVEGGLDEVRQYLGCVFSLRLVNNLCSLHDYRSYDRRRLGFWQGYLLLHYLRIGLHGFIVFLNDVKYSFASA